MSTTEAPPPAVPVESPKTGVPYWLVYLLAAVLATIGSGVIVHVMRGPLEAPLSPEYEKYRASESSADTDKAFALYREYVKENLRRVLAATGAVIAIVFGLFVGVRKGGAGWAVIAAVVGAVVAAGAAWGLAPTVAEIPESLRPSQMDPLMKGILIHAAAWGPIVLALGLTLGLASKSVSGGIIALVVGAIGAAIGVIVAVLGGAALEQFDTVEKSLITAPVSLALWSTIPVLCAGLFLTYGAFRKPAEASV